MYVGFEQSTVGKYNMVLIAYTKTYQFIKKVGSFIIWEMVGSL